LFARLAKMLTGSKKAQESNPTVIEGQQPGNDSDG
jgi:hypothetical protein